jgi:hypothetical protein
LVSVMHRSSNKPAAPNAGIASQLAIGRHWPGVGEPERCPHRALMSSTRKMPVRINEKKHSTFAGEHLIPALTDSPDAGFVSAKTGKTYSRGAVIYLGRALTPEMMLERYCRVAPPPSDRETALRRLPAYCDALQSTKIGNVLSVSYSPASLPILKVEQEYFLRETESRLP